MWSNKGKGVHENHPQNNFCVWTTAGTSTASFSLTDQVPVACSYFHKCSIYSSQSFSPEIPFSLGSQLKRVCVCEGHNACVGLLSGEDSLARLECWKIHSRALKEMKLASFSLFFFVLPSSCASHQGVSPSQKKMSASEHAVQNPHVSLQQRLLQN